MAHTESSFTSKYGTRIDYDVWTPDGEPRAVLVLAHGFGEHARRYDHVVERLLGLGLVVYAPDHRGHGRSGGKRVELKDWSDFTDDLGRLFGIATAEHPGLDRYLLGHSMGGAIALTYALDHPGDLAGLILSAPAVDVTTGVPKVVVEVGKFLGRYAPRVPVESLDANLVSRDPAVVAAYNSDPLVHHGRVPAGIARGMIVNAESLPNRLPTLQVPLLLLHGSEDGLANVNGSRMIADIVGSQDLTYTEYDGLFHEVFNEPEREQVLDDVVEWLGSRLKG
ncbi:lysophospholipase [Rhodococcus sp. OK611]|uniref:alpha/beta hydrolase n=1 Tax=Rhodococcus TaxID=1827 RepID=UPI000BCC1292|nr:MULTISPECIES: alpha/beta hydrolase [Rhodococcus]MCZ4555584.1 lysophospholipase [Rhodococcus maanshanensis]PTR37140.1 lysophospholipase [Rhodococcus sp. OK611]SNX93473.1 lysophospholipase [Rhodococcus sp. OK270]